MTKSELRQMFLERRKALSPVERAEKSRRIAVIFLKSTDLSKIRLLHTFIPFENRNEVDTSFIVHELWSRSPAIEVAVPKINFKTGEIESLVYTAETDLVENAWGVREPVDGALVDPQTVDVVLVPLLGLDQWGYRVGYGKGFYDRFLKSCRSDCLKIGLSFFPPIDRIDDIHDADIPLDLFITPENIYHKDTEAQRIEKAL